MLVGIGNYAAVGAEATLPPQAPGSARMLAAAARFGLKTARQPASSATAEPTVTAPPESRSLPEAGDGGALGVGLGMAAAVAGAVWFFFFRKKG